MKSAYELAMERLEKEQGKPAKISDKQKASIAEIDQRMTADQAEAEMMHHEQIAAAVAQGNLGDVEQMEAEFKRKKDKIREIAESEKEAVRRDASLA